MGSRVQVATSACFVASGLFLSGLGGALAFADPTPSPENPGGSHSNDGSTAGSVGSWVSRPSKRTTGEAVKTGTAENGDDSEHGNGLGGNPEHGNCGKGNSGSNGNAQGCGGTSTNTTGPTESTTKTTTQTPTSRTTTTTKTTETTTPTTTTSPPGLPGAVGGGGGGGGGGIEPPSGHPELPQMQLPPELMPPTEAQPAEPTVVGVVPGVGVAAAELPLAPINLPIVVAPSAGLGGAGGPPAAPANPALPVAPRGVGAESPAGRQQLPATAGSNIPVSSSSYRIGYTEYLRSAGMSQVAALAVPGFTGILVLTGAGGLVGYRQAKAGHAVRTGGTARFIN